MDGGDDFGLRDRVVVGLNQSKSLLLTAYPDHNWRQITVAAFVTEWQPAKRLSLVFAPRGTPNQRSQRRLAGRFRLPLRAEVSHAVAGKGVW